MDFRGDQGCGHAAAAAAASALQVRFHRAEWPRAEAPPQASPARAAAAFKPNCSTPFILEREQKSGYLLEYLFAIVSRHTKGASLCKKEPFRREKQ